LKRVKPSNGWGVGHSVIGRATIALCQLCFYELFLEALPNSMFGAPASTLNFNHGKAIGCSQKN